MLELGILQNQHRKTADYFGIYCRRTPPQKIDCHISMSVASSLGSPRELFFFFFTLQQFKALMHAKIFSLKETSRQKGLSLFVYCLADSPHIVWRLTSPCASQWGINWLDIVLLLKTNQLGRYSILGLFIIHLHSRNNYYFEALGHLVRQNSCSTSSLSNRSPFQRFFQ